MLLLCSHFPRTFQVDCVQYWLELRWRSVPQGLLWVTVNLWESYVRKPQIEVGTDRIFCWIFSGHFTDN
jgi:hypothetical protein